MATIERRPAGTVIYDDENQNIRLIRPGEEPQKRWGQSSAEAERIRRASVKWAHEQRRKQIERVKAGKPADPEPPKPVTVEQLRGNISALRAAMQTVKKGGTAYRTMYRDLEQTVDMLEALLEGREYRGTRRIEQQTSR